MVPSTRCAAAPLALPAGVLAEAARAAAVADPAESLRIVIRVAEQIGLADGASITVIHAGGRPASIVTTDIRVADADSLQYELGEGPCLDAAVTDGVFVVDNLATDRRWPRWSPRAAELGVGSSVSVHLFAAQPLGSLNLYSNSPAAMTDIRLETARIVAAQASAVLARVRATTDLQRAIDSRTTIGQAQGVLMERFRIAPARAFEVLAAYSQHHNVKLVLVAAELAETGRLPGLARLVGD